MIAKTHRFEGQNGLLFVYRRGLTVRTKYAAAKYVVNTRRTDWRVAVVVSKKVAKSAPSRNTIRRRIYEQIRVLAPSRLKNHDVVITVFDPELETVPSETIKKLVVGILKDITT